MFLFNGASVRSRLYELRKAANCVLKMAKNTRRPICYSLNITHVPFSFTAWSFSYLTYWSTLNLLIEHRLKQKT